MWNVSKKINFTFQATITQSDDQCVTIAHWLIDATTFMQVCS